MNSRGQHVIAVENILHQRAMQGGHILYIKREVPVRAFPDINVGQCLCSRHQQRPRAACEVSDLKGRQLHGVAEILLPFCGERELEKKCRRPKPRCSRCPGISRCEEASDRCGPSGRAEGLPVERKWQWPQLTGQGSLWWSLR